MKLNKHYLIIKKSNFLCVRKQALYVLQILLILALLPYALKMISIGFIELRNPLNSMILEDQIFRSSIEVQIYRNILIYPISYAVIILSIVLYLLKRISIYYLLRSFIIVCLLSILSFGGRMIFLRFIVWYLLALAFIKMSTRKSEKKCQRKGRFKYGFIIFVGFIVSYILSFLRGSFNSTVLTNNIVVYANTIILYFTGSFYYFSSILKNPKFYFVSELGYGRVFFGSIYGSIVTFLTHFNIIDKTGVYLARSIIDLPNEIGPNIYFNAFPTIYFFFIADFGFHYWFIGIIMFSLFASLVYVGFLKRSTSIIYLSNYIIIATVVVFSPFWWEYIRLELMYTMIHFFWVVPLIVIKNKHLAHSVDLG